MVLQQIFLSLPGGFILRVVAPLNFAKLDNLVARNSGCKLENLDRFLLVGQSTIQLNCFQLYLSEEYRPSLHGTSSTGKREIHHELLTILQVIPTSKQLLPYVRKLCMVPQNVALTFP